MLPLLGAGKANKALEPRVWRQALKDLVALASPAALDLLRGERTRQFPTQRETEEFRIWLEEAVEQAETKAQRVRSWRHDGSLRKGECRPALFRWNVSPVFNLFARRWIAAVPNTTANHQLSKGFRW